MESNPPLRQSNIADIKAKVQEMIGAGGGNGGVATPGGYAYTLYEGDSSTNSITLSDSAFNYDKLVLEGYYMAMGSAAMDIAVTTEWPTNKNYRKFQFTTSDLATGSTPSLTTNTDVWEVSEDGMDLDLVLALQGVDTDNITVTPESTSQITITKVTGFNNISSGPVEKESYDVPYFDGGEYGVIAYLDRQGEVAYYTATSANDLNLAGSDSGKVFKTLEDGYTINTNNVLAYSVGSQYTALTATGFLRGCLLLTHLYGAERITSIGSYFLGSCKMFNQSLVFSNNLTSMGDNFLYNCDIFNQIITLPDTLQATPTSFLYGCTSFNQPLSLPNTLTNIRSNFLYNCTRFNQPLNLPIGLTTIQTGFLYGCSAFNQPLSLPDTVATIGSANSATTGFMSNCTRFNQTLKLPLGLKTIPGYFLYGCSRFNNEIIFGDALIGIDTNFLYGATAFNHSLDLPDTLVQINAGFLQNCSNYTQPLSLPSTLTNVGDSFMFNCNNFTGPINIQATDTTFSGSGNNVLGTSTNTALMYTTGVALTGVGAEDWKTKLPDRTSSPYRKLIVATEE